MKMEYLRNVVSLRLVVETCTGCGRCLEVCPHGVFVLENGKSRIAKRDACMECGACARNCPVDALSVNSGVGCAVGMLNEALGRKGACCAEDQACCCGNGEEPGEKGRRKDRTVDEKTKELIAIGASVVAHCQPCLTYHMGKAKEMGIADDEISEAIAVGHIVEKGAMQAMRTFAEYVFEAPAGPAPDCCGAGDSVGKGCCP